MSNDLVLIVSESYEVGSRWLSYNCEKYGFDPQYVRIISNPNALRGMGKYRLVLVKDWWKHKEAQLLTQLIQEAGNAKRILETIVI